MVRNVYRVGLLPVIGCRLAYGAEPVVAPDQTPHASPVIEEIAIVVHPVFDDFNPKENNTLFRLVNRLHIDAKKHVFEKDLTFLKGDVLDRHLLEEATNSTEGRNRTIYNSSIQIDTKEVIKFLK